MFIGNIDLFGRRGQELIMVLYVLKELRRSCTKEEVLRFIREHRFYAFRPEDQESYDGKREWKSDTLLCFARKDAVENDLMFDHDEKDSWDITRTGLKVLAQVTAYFQSRPGLIQRCFMWRPEFKQLIDPNHTDFSDDHVRELSGRGMSFVEKALALLRRMSREDEKRPQV
jgi:hypothetical protein